MTQEFKVSEVKTAERPLDDAQIAFYRGEFEAGRAVAPIVVDGNLNLQDGTHRLAAAKQLGHKTIRGEFFHVASHMDLPNNQKIADAISAATKEAVARVPFIDRRQASQIRCELGTRKAQIAGQEEDQVKAEQTIVKLTGKIAALRPLLKKYQQAMPKQPHYSGLVDETAKKIATLESDLAFWKKDLDRVTRILASHKKLMAEFLSQTPGKGFPTNGEMLVADDELKKLEREAANELNAASF